MIAELVPYPPPRGVTAASLQSMVFPPIAWTVEGYVAPGLTILAGKPKIGKSWLVLDFALAVACGGVAMGARQCVAGAVLYAALEDNPRRLQDRLRKVQGANVRQPWPPNLTFWTHGEMDRLEDGGIDQLHAWRRANSDAALVIIDTLAKVRGGADGRETSYQADYREVGSLKAFADEFGVALMAVTHLRKADADDPFDTVSGTLGLTGAADATMILARDSQGVTLRATGRDIAEIETAVEFDKQAFRWRELGKAASVRRSGERNAILAALASAGEPMNPAELAAETGQSGAGVRQLLVKMARAGEVGKASRGRYLHPDATPEPPGHNDHKVTTEGAEATGFVIAGEPTGHKQGGDLRENVTGVIVVTGCSEKGRS